MSTDSPQTAPEDSDAAPGTEELEEPSTEKDPGEEPTAAVPAEPDVDHQAVGIGVVGGALNDTDDTPPGEPAAGTEESAG